MMVDFSGYTLIVIETYDGKWQTELHSPRGNNTPQDMLEVLIYPSREDLPDTTRVKMTLIDMGDDVNARARIMEEVGSRYDTPYDTPTHSGGKKRQYFLHELTVDGVKSMGFTTEQLP